MAQAQFPEPKSLNKLEIGDGVIDINPVNYSLENPHPGYGKDPNILNELGHSTYPKMVYPQGNMYPGKLVNNIEEEKTAMGIKEELKDNGPTLEEYMKHGYKASTYPPAGYVSKSSKEEIDAAIANEKTSNPWG
jgi:hypothetical protein